MASNKKQHASTSCVVYVEGKQTLLLSLKQVLEPTFEVVAMADNALSLVDAITTLTPTLVVIDMGGPTGVSSIVRHVRHRFREPILVVIIDDLDLVTQREAKSWGVQDVVLQSRVAEDLCSVARKAVQAARQSGPRSVTSVSIEQSPYGNISSARRASAPRRRKSKASSDSPQTPAR